MVDGEIGSEKGGSQGEVAVVARPLDDLDIAARAERLQAAASRAFLFDSPGAVVAIMCCGHRCALAEPHATLLRTGTLRDTALAP